MVLPDAPQSTRAQAIARLGVGDHTELSIVDCRQLESGEIAVTWRLEREEARPKRPCSSAARLTIEPAASKSPCHWGFCFPSSAAELRSAKAFPQVRGTGDS